MGAATSAAAHSMQKFAVALFDAPHEGHCSGSGAAHRQGFLSRILSSASNHPKAKRRGPFCITQRSEAAVGPQTPTRGATAACTRAGAAKPASLPLLLDGREKGKTQRVQTSAVAHAQDCLKQ
jgi:hypothetical protein